MPKKNFSKPKQPPKTNKERSKQHRLRKKKYIEDTLQENIDLKEQLCVLKLENSELKLQLQKLQNLKPFQSSSSVTQFEHRLLEYEDYAYNKLFKKVGTNPEKVRYSEIEQTIENICDWSDNRIDYIKSLFNKILENMIGIGSKCYYAGHKAFPIKNWYVDEKLRKEERNILRKHLRRRKSKVSLLTFRLLIDLKKFAKNLTKTLAASIENTNKIAQSLIKQRNALLNHYQEIKTFISTLDRSSYTKQDILNDLHIINCIKTTNLTSPHNLYQIPVKSHSCSKYEAGELTE
ncbi:unnamed protein product [Moneuplotes crassus]|uniref:BZIP domain-containing protein n=1 Tax=Euplotes crassus TaxID=5936 RepID=A0AAD2D0E6_EUPCR|nr:unnamed protein product [Moneuplotes crassus]